MIAPRSASIKPADMPCNVLGRRVVRPVAESIHRPASSPLMSSSEASSTPGNSPATAADTDAAGLRGLEFLETAASELGDHARLQVMGAVLQSPRGVERADQLVVGQPRQVGARLLGQRGQHRVGPQHVRGGVLAELRAERIAAQAIRPAYGGQHRRIDVGRVTEAQRDRRTLDLPRLGRLLVTARGDLPLAPGHVRIPLRVRSQSADREGRRPCSPASGRTRAARARPCTVPPSG